MSDAEKLAEEIVRVLESQLEALDMLRSPGPFAVLDRWKEDHAQGRP